MPRSGGRPTSASYLPPARKCHWRFPSAGRRTNLLLWNHSLIVRSHTRHGACKHRRLNRRTSSFFPSFPRRSPLPPSRQNYFFTEYPNFSCSAQEEIHIFHESVSADTPFQMKRQCFSFSYHIFRKKGRPDRPHPPVSLITCFNTFDSAVSGASCPFFCSKVSRSADHGDNSLFVGFPWALETVYPKYFWSVSQIAPVPKPFKWHGDGALHPGGASVAYRFSTSGL